LSFGDSSKLKFVKKIILTLFDGANTTIALNWAYDYAVDYTKQAFTLEGNSSAQYNISEYNTTAEYSTSGSLITRQSVNASGSGSVVSVGLEATISGNSIALQEINIHALIGRMV